MTVSLEELHRALGGEIVSGGVSCAGPGHPSHDRSMRAFPRADGFGTASFAGDDFRLCRDYVAERLGLPTDSWRDRREPDPLEIERRRKAKQRADREREAGIARRQSMAGAIWSQAHNPLGTIVVPYLRSRGLELTPDIAGRVIRFHPACPWERTAVPAMIAAMRCIRTGKLTAIQRTALSADANKIGRAMLGPAGGAAIMIDPDENVTLGLTIGEGFETCLTARQWGMGPVWALGSAGGIAKFPLLSGIESLTVLQEHDKSGTNQRACREVADVWHGAERSVDLIIPKRGANDLNDVLRSEVAA